MTWVHIITLIELCVGAAGTLVFIVLYWMRSRGAWRRTAIGRNVMVLMMSLALIMLLDVAHAFLGDYPGRELLVTTLLGVLTYVIWGRVWLIEKIFHEHRDDPVTKRIT